MAGSQHGAITLDWGDGEHRFRLDLPGIEDIEAKCDRSLFDIARRAHPFSPDIRQTEMREVLRCGLIGGGMEPAKALALVRRYLDERPREESRDVVYAIVLAGLTRVQGDASTGSGAEAAEGETGELISPSGSTSPQSAAPQPSSESTGQP